MCNVLCGTGVTDGYSWLMALAKVPRFRFVLARASSSSDFLLSSNDNESSTMTATAQLYLRDTFLSL